jgi:hypothetical protein
LGIERIAPDAEIPSDPDTKACCEVVKLYPVNNGGSPFRFELGFIVKRGRATFCFCLISFVS